MKRNAGGVRAGASRAVRRVQAFWSVGQNLDAGAIYLPRADKEDGVPARRMPGGVACAAFAEAIKAVAAQPREV